MDHGEAELESLLKKNQQLQQENTLFESFYERMKEEYGDEIRKEKRHKRKQRAQQTLTLAQKLEVANSEFESIQKEITETRENSEKLIETLKAVLEETDIRISELKKDAYEFKRDIVVGAENIRSGKTVAEKVVRYMEDKLNAKDAVIDKLRLKNATLKTQIQKVDSQLRQKEEMGDVLHFIDFHQLQIENKQYVAKIEERNQELLRLKMTTGNTVQVLNSLKKKLNVLISESEWLHQELGMRTDTLQKIKADNKRVQQELVHEESGLKRMSNCDEDREGMPHVLDYVAQKAQMYELEATVKNMQRKIEIAEMAAKRRRAQRRAAETVLQGSGNQGAQQRRASGRGGY